MLAPAECQLPALVLTRAHGPFRVVGSILETVHGPGLVCLIRLGEFSDALLVSVRSLRKPLGITRLSGAVRSRFLRFASKLIEPSLVIPQFTCHHKQPPYWAESSAMQDVQFCADRPPLVLNPH